MEAARTRTSTPSSPSTGFGTSFSSRTSGEPYLSRTIALIVGWFVVGCAFVVASACNCAVIFSPSSGWLCPCVGLHLRVPPVRCKVPYGVRLSRPRSWDAASASMEANGETSRGDRGTTRAFEQGACAAHRHATRRSGRDRIAQHAQARAGARSRGDVALLLRGQQGRHPERHRRRR